MGEKKTNPRLTSSDLYILIARRSKNLNMEQVKECFTIYADLYRTLMNSEKTAFDFEFPLPHLGIFTQRRHHGKKAGAPIRIFDWETRTYHDGILKEDRPDYVRPMFKLKRSIYEERKNASKRRWIKGWEQSGREEETKTETEN